MRLKRARSKRSNSIVEKPEDERFETEGTSVIDEDANEEEKGDEDSQD
jgi:hypothetical protein